ncbi:MAG: hypothetical protein WD512_16700 [Candidatus Paceibacterota bacterium]
MKVYLVEINVEDEFPEDCRVYIEKAFADYRKAAQYLVDVEYKPYAKSLFADIVEDVDWDQYHYIYPTYARIIEMKLNE